MRKTQFRRLVMVLAAMSCAACAQPDEPPFLHTRALDSLGMAALEEGPLVGLSIAVAQDGELIFEGGWGVTDIDSRAPATPNTVYNLASTAKILAAATVMRLVETDQLTLDDSLGALLPDVPNVDAVGGITLRQLLNMTAGLNDYVGADVDRLATSEEPLSPGFVLDYVRRRPLDFEPGTNWIYSNTGFYLAGLIVERVTGVEWGDYVIDEVVGPLGLEDTQLCDDAGDERSVGYEWSDGSLVRSRLDAERGVRGDAGLCSTVRDMARLPAALKSRGVISESGLATMISPTQLNTGVAVDYGLGVSRGTFAGHELWGHLGGSGSIVSTLAHYPDVGITIAVLVNTRRASVGALALEGRVAAVVLNAEPQLLNRSISPEAAADLVGRYMGDRAKARFEIAYENDSLVRRRTEEPEAVLTLLSQGGRTFGRSDWPFDRFVFQPDTGQAIAYSVYYNGFFDGFYSRTGN